MTLRPDPRTLALFGAHTVLFAGNAWGAATGRLPWWAALVIGLFVFNMSFTLWHECVHNTVTASRGTNTLVGWLTAVLMIYPGYFALKKEHLLHHKYQGDPDRDPVWPRIQCAPLAFPFHLLWTYVFNPQPRNPEARLTARERFLDGLGSLLAAVAIGWALARGLWLPLLAAWLLPRAVMIPLHAFYVCYLPHAKRGPKIYETYRIVLRNPLTRYLSLYHSFHGLHHVWPTIPWHRYRRTFLARRKELEAKGVEILGEWT